MPDCVFKIARKSFIKPRKSASHSRKKIKKAPEFFINRILSCGFGDPVREYIFHPTRKWRFDCAFPDAKIALEYEGGIWTDGAHTRGKHFISDTEKYNSAAILGWSVLRYTVNTIKNIDGELKELMRLKKGEALGEETRRGVQAGV